MDNKNYIAPFIFFSLNIISMLLFMRKRFSKLIKKIQKEEPVYNKLYIAISYIIMISGLLIFVIPNISNDNIFLDSLKYGGIFGFVVYGIYDFTNLSIFKNYEFSTAIIDILSGTSVYFLTTFLTFKLTTDTNSSLI